MASLSFIQSHKSKLQIQEPQFSYDGDVSQSVQSRGVLLYDADCGFCRNAVAKLRPTLTRNGFVIGTLQEHETSLKLGAQLTRDVLFRTPQNKLVRGSEVYLYVMRRIWWAAPLAWILTLPGLRSIFDRVYRWVAANRHRLSKQSCSVQPPLAT